MKRTQLYSRRLKSKHCGQLESPNFEDEQQKGTELKEGRGLGSVSLADAEREQQSTSFPSGSDLDYQDPFPRKLSSSSLPSGNRFPMLGGYPSSTHQNRPYHGYSRMQHSGLYQEFGTFRGQQTHQSVRIYLLYSTAYPQTMFDTSLIPLIGIASRFWHTTKSLLLLYPRFK